MAKKRINSKAKGNRTELELVKILEENFGEGRFKRVPSSGALTGGKNRERTENLSPEAKIILAADIITPINFNFILESKGYAAASFWDLFNESSNLNEWVEQVTGDAEFVGKLPMLIVRYDRHKRIVFIREKVEDYAFEWKGWYCYLLSELLENTNHEFWFSKE